MDLKFKDNFTLNKIKVGEKQIFVDFDADVANDTKKTTDRKNDKVTLPFIPHPDMLNCLSGLKEYLLRTQRHYDVYEEAVKYLKGEQKQKVEGIFKSLTSDCECTGVSVGGSNQMEGCVITGKIENEAGGNSAMNSPHIRYANNSLGYEKDVQKLVKLLTVEAYKAIYQGKRGDSTLFDTQVNDASEVKAKAG